MQVLQCPLCGRELKADGPQVSGDLLRQAMEVHWRKFCLGYDGTAR